MIFHCKFSPSRVLYLHRIVKRHSTYVLASFNNIHESIRFTIEHPETDNSLSLLDFKLRFNGEVITTTYYQKDAKKPLFINYLLALPTEMKLNIVKNERNRRLERCSDNQQKKQCEREFENILQLNDYPPNFMSR